MEDQRRSISEALLENCIMPRVTITPEDALFCAIFFKQLHSLETTNFSSLQYQEARCLGIFLRATFEPLTRWRFDRRRYDMEAGSKLGFSVAIGSASRCTYEQYCTVFTKWHDKITKVALHSLSHYKDHGRACLLVLIKLIGVYPIYKHVSTQLLGLLEAIQVQEDMKDVQAMAKRYCTLLKKSEDTLVEESLLQRDILGSKAQVPAPGTKRQASAANKQRRSPKVSLARRCPKGSGTPVGQSGTTHAQTSDTSAIHNFRVPVRSVTYPPGGGLLAVLWPQGWVYWPNNGHCSPCHTK